MKKIKNTFSTSFFKASVIVAIFTLCLAMVPSSKVKPAYASLQDDLNTIQKQIKDTKGKIEQKQNEAASLEKEVAVFDDQIKQTELRIQQTETEIKINKEKITQTEEDLRIQREVLNEYLRVIYEESNTSALELIASSDSFSDFVDRSEYLQTMQMKIKDTVEKIKKMREELEVKKKELSKLKDQLSSQRTDLNTKRSGRQALLDHTRGEEAEYQALSEKLKAQQKTIQSALWASSNYTSQGPVKQGEVIGYIGNSGFSTGCHLHFEIRTDPNTHVNPASYMGDGYFINPVPGVGVSAPYGYSDSYFSGVFHSGIDYADGCAGTPILATADGDIVERVSGRPNTYPYSYEYGNYVKIRHTNGMFSLYGHLR